MSSTIALLIRHGETDWNVARRWQGHRDIPLNQTGREQAGVLARRLARWPRPITAIYASDLKRAEETGSIVARHLDLECVVDAVWRERHGGIFQGLTRDEIVDKHPEAWARYRRGGVDLPGGETMEQLRQRIARGTEALLERHPGETVAVISHGGALYALILYVLGVDPAQGLPIRVNRNTGITVVELRQESPHWLVRLNDTAHLEMGPHLETVRALEADPGGDVG
ncbi:MAG: histidine phosphatase family protein [Chloroflexota bacterium]